MDEGVMHLMKTKYRPKIVQKMIEMMGSRKWKGPHISSLEVMKRLVFAWNDISSNTIPNYFKKTCFPHSGHDDDLFDDPFSILKDSIVELSFGDKNTVSKNASFRDVLKSSRHYHAKGNTYFVKWCFISSMQYFIINLFDYFMPVFTFLGK